MVSKDIRAIKQQLTGYTGDTAVALLKEGADHTIKNAEDVVALDLAPDKAVGASESKRVASSDKVCQVRQYIIQGAEREGIDLE